MIYFPDDTSALKSNDLLTIIKYQNRGEDRMKCPFCENEFEKEKVLIEKIQTGLKESHYAYFCPRCENEL
jgi:uncharacterized protein (DUF2225 family)